MQPLELPPAARLRFGAANNIGRCVMPRAKAFDHDQVLDRAMRLFWRKGYEATSISRYPEKLARYDRLMSQGVEIVPKRCFQKTLSAWNVPSLVDDSIPEQALRAS